MQPTRAGGVNQRTGVSGRTQGPKTTGTKANDTRGNRENTARARHSPHTPIDLGMGYQGRQPPWPSTFREYHTPGSWTKWEHCRQADPKRAQDTNTKPKTAEPTKTEPETTKRDPRQTYKEGNPSTYHRVTQHGTPRSRPNTNVRTRPKPERMGNP